jgi:hypothetical protein
MRIIIKGHISTPILLRYELSGKTEEMRNTAAKGSRQQIIRRRCFSS